MELPLYATILIASIASFILGWIWYGPLFGNTWKKENKITKEEENKHKTKKILYHYLLTLLYTTIIISILEIAQGTLTEKMVFTTLLWLGFFLTTRLSNMIWTKQSWKNLWIDTSYQLITIQLITVLQTLL